MENAELATLAWVNGYNHHRLLSSIGYRPPAHAEADYHQSMSTLLMAA
jgi:transposase InsO family protein